MSLGLTRPHTACLNSVHCCVTSVYQTNQPSMLGVVGNYEAPKQLLLKIAAMWLLGS